MRVEAIFAALDAAPVAGLDDLAGRRGLVVVAPHPDDESLGCGGLIVLARRENRPVRLLVVSDGCGSHAGSRLYPPERLRALREAETRDAAAILGLAPDALRFLRLPDAAVPQAGPDAAAAAAAIAEAAREIAAGAVFVTWRHDPHCDHEAAAAIVDLARPHMSGVRVFAYPVWGRTLPPDAERPAPGRCVRLDVASARDVKRRAVMAHRSQVTDLVPDVPTGFRLAPAMIDGLCGPFEGFIEERP